MEIDSNYVFDFTKVCRLCLQKNNSLASIFEEVLPLRIMECVSLEVRLGDGLPGQMCSKCLTQLNTWHTFKQMCRRSDAMLQKYISRRQIEPVVDVKVKAESWTSPISPPSPEPAFDEYNQGDSHDDEEEDDGKFFDLNTPPGWNTERSTSATTSKPPHSGFHCSKCDITFEEEPFLLNHYRLIHPPTSHHSCYFCGETQESGIAQIHHERTHVQDMQKNSVTKKKQSPTKRRGRSRKKSCTESESSSQDDDSVEDGSDTQEPEKTSVEEGIPSAKDDGGVQPLPPRKGKQVCLVCGKKFLCMAVLVNHERRVHLGEPVFQCKDCGKCYTTKRTLTTHMGSHQPDKHHPCDICGKKFTHKTLMAQHKVLVHSKVKPYSCSTCGKSFIRRYMLKTHQVVHTKEKNFNCEHCHKNFSRRESLKVHMRCHAEGPVVKYIPPRRYMCTLCGKDYISPGELNRHELVTHKGERPFKCDQCDKGYASKFSLQVHQAIHTAERNHICEQCGKSFNHSTRLSQHKSLVHHEGKKFRCFICSKCFLKPSLLKKHQVVHTGERFELCHKCDKTFGTREGLKQHLKTHAEVKRFYCVSCGKRFAVNKSLKAHKCDGKPFVDKEKTIGCPNCGKMFISKKTLGRHMVLNRCAAPH